MAASTAAVIATRGACLQYVSRARRRNPPAKVKANTRPSRTFRPSSGAGLLWACGRVNRDSESRP